MPREGRTPLTASDANGRWNRWAVAAVCCWLTAGTVVGIRVGMQPGRQSVYPIYARAAQHWLERGDLYLLTDLDKVSCNAFRYSPLAAACLTPFRCLPDGAAEFLWRVLNLGVFLGALAWWSRSGLPRRCTRRQRAMLFLLVLPLALGNVNNGQSNLLVLGLLLTGVTAAATCRWNLAAGAVALACLFKIYPVAVGLLLAAIYPRPFSLRFVAALAIGLILPFAFQDPGYVWAQYQAWALNLRLDDRHAWAVEAGYRDLSLLFRVYLSPLSPETYRLVQLAAALGVLGLCVAAHRAEWPPRRLTAWLLALACVWMTVFGAATESSTYVLLAPSLAWALVESREDKSRGLLLASYGLLLATQLANWIPGASGKVQALGPQPLAGLLLLAALLVGNVRRPLPSTHEDTVYLSMARVI